MKRQIINLAIISICFLTVSSQYPIDVKQYEYDKFSISFQQNGKQVEIKNNVVELEKGVFDIVFELSAPMVVLINASFDSKTYKLASKDKHLEMLPGFKETGIAEGLFNSNRDISLSYNAPNCWFYDRDNENRFNSFISTSKGFTCTRTIEKLVDIDTKTTIAASDVDKPLYLVFITTKRREGPTERVEIQREYVKIKWKE